MKPSDQPMPEAKSPQIAFLLWGLGFVGICGVHRMYLEQYNLGSAMLATFGFLGVGQLVDVLSITKEVEDHNRSNGIYSKKPDNGTDSFSIKSETAETTSRMVANDVYEEDDLMKEAAEIEQTLKKLRDKN